VRWGAALLLLAALPVAGCETRERRLPDAEEAGALYGNGLEARMSGNLLELRIELDEQLERGGGIWIRGAPYFYLISPTTRDLFAEYEDLAAVRAVVMDSRGRELSRATLERDVISSVRWREGLALAGLARRDGTERPRTIEELTAWGEERTEFSYPGSPRP
jgi:hypothetical protein